MDYLVQRFIPTTANEAHRSSGTWEDVGVARKLKADEEKKAADQVMAGVPPLPADQGNRIRVVKWDHVAEFDATLAGYQLDPQPKTPRPDAA